jgi:hypothetical protein
MNKATKQSEADKLALGKSGRGKGRHQKRNRRGRKNGANRKTGK